MFNWMKRNSVISYFIIAYVVSWSFEIPLALFHQGIISVQIPMWFTLLCLPWPAERRTDHDISHRWPFRAA